MPKSINSNSSVSNRDLYDAINGLRSEFGSAIQRLDDKFMQLEAGRLTRLEGKMSDFEIAQSKRDSQAQANQASLSTKVVIIWSMIGSVFVAFITALAYRVVVK